MGLKGGQHEHNLRGSKYITQADAELLKPLLLEKSMSVAQMLKACGKEQKTSLVNASYVLDALEYFGLFVYQTENCHYRLATPEAYEAVAEEKRRLFLCSRTQYGENYL